MQVPLTTNTEVFNERQRLPFSSFNEAFCLHASRQITHACLTRLLGRHEINTLYSGWQVPCH